MKTKLALIALAAFGGLAALTNSAAANPSIRVGIHIGSPAPIIRVAAPVYCAPAPVVVSHYDRYDHGNRHDRYDRYDRPSGYWKEVVVKTWVPSCHVTRLDRRGRPVRIVEPGHFTYRTDRVWVSTRG